MITDLPLLAMAHVLYPGTLRTLQVVEPSELAFLRAVLGGTRTFGLVGILDGGLLPRAPASRMRAHDLGCIATITRETAAGNGSIELVVEGRARFSVVELRRRHPWPIAQIETLAEPLGDDAAVWLARVRPLYGRYCSALHSLQAAPSPRHRSLAPLPLDPLAASYTVASCLTLDLPEHQRLLMASDCAARLALEVGILRREIALLTQAQARAFPEAPAGTDPYRQN